MTTRIAATQVSPRIDVEMICPYEAGRPIEEVRRVLGLTRVIKLASNENPLGPSRQVIDTLNRSDLELHTYPDFEGWYLRHALAERLHVSVDQLVLGAGSVELMRVIADAFLGPGDEAIVADICFPVYANVARLAGAYPVTIPLDDDLQFDLERIEQQARAPRTKVVFLASPNNPTGRLIPLADLEAFLRRLSTRILCVLDLAYWEYVDGASDATVVELLASHPNLVVLRTFSKVYGLAGLRVGYAVSSAAVASWLNRVRIPFSCSTAAQVAARAALQDEEHVRRSVDLNRRMLARATLEMSELGGTVWPSQANFVLVDFRVDSETMFQSLLRRGIIVRPVRHPRLARCLRITTGTSEQMDELMAALREELMARSANRTN